LFCVLYIVAFEVCGGFREIYIAFRLSRGCTLPQWWLVTPY